MAFSDWLRDLKAFRTEVDQTTRSLRQLDGQMGTAAPGATRSGYVSGVEQGNQNSGAALHSSPGMPIAFAAGMAMSRPGLVQPIVDAVRQGSVARIAIPVIRPTTVSGGMIDALANIANRSGDVVQSSRTTMAAERGMRPGFEGYPSATDSAAIGRGNIRSQMDEIWASSQRSATIPGARQVGLHGMPLGGGQFSRQVGFNQAPGMAARASASVGRGASVIRSQLPPTQHMLAGGLALGAFVGNKLLQQDSKYWAGQPREERPRLYDSPRDKFSYNDSFMGNVSDAASLFGQNLGEVIRTSSKELSGYAGMMGGYRAYTKMTSGGTSGRFLGKGGGLGSGIKSLGVTAILQTAINLLPNAIDGATAVWNGTDTREERDFRRQANEVRKLDFVERIQRALPGRQGGSIVAQKMLRGEADVVAAQGYTDAWVGGSDSITRRLANAMPILGGMIRSNEELLAEAQKRLEEKDKRQMEFKRKGWEDMTQGSFSKAKYNFEQLSMMTDERSRKASWKNPLVIFAACQEARMMSRHYAASFSTRNRERTGD